MKRTSSEPAAMREDAPRALRIFTFGMFHIEWVDLATGQVQLLPPDRLTGRGTAPALALLKALLCCPDRYATRDWILEQFWPDSNSRSAGNRLDDVASALRGLLRPAGTQGKMLHFVYGANGRGNGYRLDAYPLLWCDADAFEWYVKHALLLDRMGKDSSLCWERASTFATRGPYLAEFIYEEWVCARRRKLEGLQRDCVQCWCARLHQDGSVKKAISHLRTYWQEHPTDEDALRLLLPMLGEQKRYQEAEKCYRATEAALKEEGEQPDPRTQDMLEYVRALPFSSSKHAVLLGGKSDVEPCVLDGFNQSAREASARKRRG